MDTAVAAGLFVVGLGLIFHFREELVKGAVGAASGFGMAAYVVSIVLIVMDPGSLIVGMTAVLRGMPGIALGTVVGASMVPMALSSGVSALVAPVEFQASPRRVLLLPLLAQVLFGLLSLDGGLSRTDGSVLLLGFVLAVLYLLRLSRRGLDIRPSGEIVAVLDKGVALPRWESVSLAAVAVVALIIGSVILIAGARELIPGLRLTETGFGMSILALLVSLEGLVRELPAVMKKRSRISYGVITGPTLAFFLFNAGAIASLAPLPVNGQTLSFHLPFTMASTIVISLFMLAGRIPRWGGAVLVLLYAAFFAGSLLVPWD